MPRLILPLVVLLAALVGCSADDSHKPDADWAMSLCKRVLKHDELTTTKSPFGIELLDARVVTAAEAKGLEGGFVPTNGGMAPIRYGASCKIRLLHPRTSGIQNGKGAAVLAFAEGSTAFVRDPYWAK